MFVLGLIFDLWPLTLVTDILYYTRSTWFVTFNSRHIWFKQRDKRTGSDIWITNNSESSRRQMRKANKKLKNKRLFVSRLACCLEVQLRRKLRSKVPCNGVARHRGQPSKERALKGHRGTRLLSIWGTFLTECASFSAFFYTAGITRARAIYSSFTLDFMSGS